MVLSYPITPRRSSIVSLDAQTINLCHHTVYLAGLRSDLDVATMSFHSRLAFHGWTQPYKDPPWLLWRCYAGRHRLAEP